MPERLYGFKIGETVQVGDTHCGSIQFPALVGKVLRRAAGRKKLVVEIVNRRGLKLEMVCSTSMLRRVKP